MDEAEFVAKIEWEGGIIDALDYGLKPDDCEPGPMRDAWAALYAKWKDLLPEMRTVELMVEDRVR